uniref:ATP synthase complex subunit 8 n=1 Tax=Sabethes glaucodaemon TaxID=2153043 RepID=A0A343W3Z8_9DIPT|nr:ATP synthase F0 subunit 8 [Sabethes glaucodaemon]AVV61100.1 ATP synthase F0 subunit 8 [Sabethes glaucodaemon]
MPQMAPISWLTLFFIFSITFMLFIMKTYYCNILSLPQTSQSLMFKKNSLNWKW